MSFAFPEKTSFFGWLEVCEIEILVIKQNDYYSWILLKKLLPKAPKIISVASAINPEFSAKVGQPDSRHFHQ